jgi:hypothetical protein
MFLKGIFLTNISKNNHQKQVNNKSCIPIYMDTSFSTHLELLFVLCTSDQPINCEGDHPVNIPTKFGSK